MFVKINLTLCAIILLLAGCILEGDIDEMRKAAAGDFYVEYDANGGTGSMSRSVFTAYGEDKKYEHYCTLSPNRFTHPSNLDFLGWSRDRNKFYVDYHDQGTFYTYDHTKGSTITLYAMWGVKELSHNNYDTTLTSNGWGDGNLTNSSAGAADWYSFNAPSGKTYLWWNDTDNDSSKTLDIKVAAYTSEGILLFDQNTPNDNSFTVSGGRIYIKVYPNNSGNTGTYSIMYNTDGWKTPTSYTGLDSWSWQNGNLTNSSTGAADWYSFDAYSEGGYYLWWNDTDNDSSKTLDIKVAAYTSTGMLLFDQNTPNDNSFTVSGGRIYIKVYPNNSGNTGTYSIVYTTSGTRPSRDALKNRM